VKKFLLTLFILVDLVVLVGAAGFLFFYVQGKPLPIPESMMPVRLPTRSPTAVSAPAAAPVIPAAPVAVSTGTSSAFIPPVVNSGAPGVRNLRFTYKNSKAKEVAIRADFTGWRAKPMTRDAAGVWTFDAQLTPGEYAYCFAVDSKIIPDPASKRSKRIGQNTVSAIEVKPAPAK